MKSKLNLIVVLTGLFIAPLLVNARPVNDPAEVLEAPGGSKLITDWIAVHLKTIRNSRIPSHHQRQLAYTGVALYESLVPGDRNYRSLAGQLNGFKPELDPPSGDNTCWQASANAALAKMFGYFYPQNPGDVARFDSLKQTWEKQLLKEGYDEASITSAAQYGTQVAQAVFEWSKADGEDQANRPYSVPKGPGLWEPTPPVFRNPIEPYMGNDRTIVAGSIDNTLPPPPVPFSMEKQSAFYKMANEVFETSQQLDEEKRSTALFWDDFPDMKSLTSSGHWESILRTVMTDKNLSLIEGAHAFAALFITMNDAAIGCFKAKYTYNLLRPVTFIQKNMNYPEWNPLIVTPPHPEYPAAHATVSMSAANILTYVLGDHLSFTDNSYAYRGYKAHHFNNFREAGREAGFSRLYGGIHYRPSIEAGFEQGIKIADTISKSIIFKNQVAVVR